MHSILSLLWGSMCTMYYLALYNSAELRGNVLTLGLMFGISECLGVILGERFLKFFPDYICSYISLIIILSTSILL